MTTSMRGLKGTRATAERVAAAARDPSLLDEVRRAAQRDLAGVDPEAIARDGDDFRAAQAELVLAVVTALEERSLSRETAELLLKANRARVLEAVSLHPGKNQRQLAAALELAPSNLNDYLGELGGHGLIEQTAPVEGRGVAYQITPWGRQAMSYMAAHHPKAGAGAIAVRPASAAKASARAGKASPVARISSARAGAPARPKNGLKRDDR